MFGVAIALTEVLPEFQGAWEFKGMRSFAWWPTLIVISLATFTDMRSRRIPNWLVFPFMLAGMAVSPWRQNWPGIGRPSSM